MIWFCTNAVAFSSEQGYSHAEANNIALIGGYLRIADGEVCLRAKVIALPRDLGPGFGEPTGIDRIRPVASDKPQDTVR